MGCLGEEDLVSSTILNRRLSRPATMIDGAAIAGMFNMSKKKK
jgi:hypothetical protein